MSEELKKVDPANPEVIIPKGTRTTSILIKILAIYAGLFLIFVVGGVLLTSHDPMVRAEFMMLLGLVILWIITGGILSLRYRDRIRERFLGISVRWEWKFLLFAILMALIEEAITTGMTNLAPEFGSQISVAHITASSNYLVVIAFSSVVVFIPEFVGWTLLLRRYAFNANQVFLMYGLLGTTMEATLNVTALYSGFWFFVYGLMVYLPAYCIPSDRGARKPAWYHYVLAYIVPLLIALPVAVGDIQLAKALGIVLW